MDLLAGGSRDPQQLHFTHLGRGSLVVRNSVNIVKRLTHFTLKEALIEIGCVVTSFVVGCLVGWLSRACTVAKRCILGL